MSILRMAALAMSTTALKAPSAAKLASLLPTRPQPPAPSTARELDGAALVGMTRVGEAVVAPDGKRAVLSTKEYDFKAKKFDETLWMVDLDKAAALGDDALRKHEHLTPLVSGSASAPCWSPCGEWIAFLSDREDGKDDKNKAKTAVWLLPASRPGEATLLKRFPVDVSDLDWTSDGLVVAARVYVDGDDAGMAATAARDEEIEKRGGGLDAHLFKRLPVREWDRWLDAKFAHPFLQRVERRDGSYVCVGDPVDGLHRIPTSCPSGAFGGKGDWAVHGRVAFSCRPPLAEDEAWTTNRHIYTKGGFEGEEATCLTAENPGYDFAPVFSPDGSRLAWLTMAGGNYESDAVGIRLHDVKAGATTDLLVAEQDFAWSPQSLEWAKDGTAIYFHADVKARRRLCSISLTGAVTILGDDDAGSTTLHGESAQGLLVARDSLSRPAELALLREDGASERRITFFNDARLADVDLGAVEDVSYRTDRPGRESPDGADIQAWLIRPARFDETKKYPLCVVVHGGPQGSTGDDWHYRWNLQCLASAGFAVLAPNFRGSTGFGHAYCRDVSGDWAIGPDDSVAGVEHALATYAWLDPSKVVGLGASYGGFSMNYLNGNAPKDMFCALVNHDGLFDMRSGYWSTEELFFMEKEFDGPPCDAAASDPESPYNVASPSLKVAEWRTPTLVIQGDKDYRLVTSEAISTFTALQRQGVASELLFFPDENHHCLNPQNSLVWHDAVLAWCRRWT